MIILAGFRSKGCKITRQCSEPRIVDLGCEHEALDHAVLAEDRIQPRSSKESTFIGPLHLLALGVSDRHFTECFTNAKLCC